PKRLAKSLSGPVVPPVFPFISRNARVPMYQPCSSSPPTPSGSFSPWWGPAPYPSSEIAKLWTRSLDMESSAGFICVEWAVPKSTGEGWCGAPKLDHRTMVKERGGLKGDYSRQRKMRANLGRRMTRALARHPPLRPLTYLHLPQRLEPTRISSTKSFGCSLIRDLLLGGETRGRRCTGKRG